MLRVTEWIVPREYGVGLRASSTALITAPPRSKQVGAEGGASATRARGACMHDRVQRRVDSLCHLRGSRRWIDGGAPRIQRWQSQTLRKVCSSILR